MGSMSTLSWTKRYLVGVPGRLALTAFAGALAGDPEVTIRIEVKLEVAGREYGGPATTNRFVADAPHANESATPANASTPATTAPAVTLPPEVAIVVGDPQGVTSTVVAMTAAGKTRQLGIVSHRDGAAIRAATTGNGGVAVNADVSPGKDLSFVGGLFLVHEGEETRTLALDVVHASTPHVLGDGRILVSRGVPGPESPGVARADDLTVDAVDATTGEVATIASFHGYLLFIAGTLGDEVLLYRIGEGHADVIAVDVRTSKERTLIAEINPYARDFSVDAVTRTLVYSNHEAEPSASSEWFTERLDLASLKAERLEEGPSMEVTPHALPGGDVLLTLDAEKGASRLSGGPLEIGAGVSEIADIDPSAHFATGTVAMPGALGRPFVVDLSTGKTRPFPVPNEKRAIVAGFMGGKR